MTPGEELNHKNIRDPLEPGVEDSLRFKNFFQHCAKERMSDLRWKLIWSGIRIIYGYIKLF